DVAPCPLDQDQQTVLEADDKEEMNKEPRQPGEVAVESQPAEVGDGTGAADRRHAALVLVDKRRHRLALESRLAQPGVVAALLHVALGDTGPRLAFPPIAAGQVADSHQFRVPGYRQV